MGPSNIVSQMERPTKVRKSAGWSRLAGSLRVVCAKGTVARWFCNDRNANWSSIGRVLA